MSSKFDLVAFSQNDAPLTTTGGTNLRPLINHIILQIKSLEDKLDALITPLGRGSASIDKTFSAYDQYRAAYRQEFPDTLVTRLTELRLRPHELRDLTRYSKIMNTNYSQFPLSIYGLDCNNKKEADDVIVNARMRYHWAIAPAERVNSMIEDYINTSNTYTDARITDIQNKFNKRIEDLERNALRVESEKPTTNQYSMLLHTYSKTTDLLIAILSIGLLILCIRGTFDITTKEMILSSSDLID